MRKILLGTTAIAAAALFGADAAYAQAPAPTEGITARVGGYMRFNYYFVNQDGNNSANPATAPSNAQNTPITVSGTPPAVAAPGTAQRTNTGKSDFGADAEIHVIVTGKAANGLSYGSVIEVQVDFNDGNGTSGQGAAGGVGYPRNAASKTQLDIDEMWLFVASPTLGQLRFGDEDGPLGGLMNSGHITNFATGGVDGDWSNAVIRAPGGGGRNGTTFPGDLGDNTKIIYLSPQFFGALDFGASFSFNQGEGQDTGCPYNFATAGCDRLGATSSGIVRRRNEWQLAARYRGTFEGVGISISGGVIFADATKNLNGTATATNIAGSGGQGVVNPFIYNIGAQVSAFGFLVGGWYALGSANAGNGPLLRENAALGTVDARDFGQWFAGISYTAGPWVVGANSYRLTTAGNQAVSAGRNEFGWSVGATYNLAPGLQVVGEYTSLKRREYGFNFLTNQITGTNTNSEVTADVFIAGIRMAW